MGVRAVPVFVGIPQPRAQAHVENGHQEPQHRGGRIAHIGIGRSAGDRNGGTNSQPARAAILPGVAVTLGSVAAEEWSHGEGLRLALLPR